MSTVGLKSIENNCQYLLSRRYQILRKAEYFLDTLPRILTKDYLPSDADIIQCYIMTTGIHPVPLDMEGSGSFTLLDFGGQRSERKKWVNCFKDAGMVIFVASLDEYEEELFEEPTVNRMSESLTLFDSILNSRWFIDVPMVLFLNRGDLFAQKMSHDSGLPVDLFPDYVGGNDVNAALQYIMGRYLSCNKAGRPLKIYLTSAVDEVQIKSAQC
ncbi:guanine nucleotide binding protein, alpha subunit [Rhodocollybia butyracea]|uniref:Guanine nucleotide binding protein, alpha subunit n=1 Tax=Rhodocollybia butyracea TaxID=206335 RepID=A0A9P5PG76_9AGAR|nr:guanine nucleotide binding protein, alpha subunit [Rhodocollybia butyracea]